MTMTQYRKVEAALMRKGWYSYVDDRDGHEMLLMYFEGSDMPIGLRDLTTGNTVTRAAYLHQIKYILVD